MARCAYVASSARGLGGQGFGSPWRIGTGMSRGAITAALLVAVLASCGGVPAGSPNATATTTPPSATAGATIMPATAAATPAATPSPTPVPEAFVSPFYHYSLLLPAEAAAFAWHPAEHAWDGVARMDSESDAIDRVVTAGGTLFAFGQPTHADLTAYRAQIIDALTRWHPCSGVTERTTKIAREPARLIACTSEPFLVTRLVLVHHGFGLVLTLDYEDTAPAEGQMALLESYAAPIKLLP
jgi:hypothetical protein